MHLPILLFTFLIMIILIVINNVLVLVLCSKTVHSYLQQNTALVI